MFNFQLYEEGVIYGVRYHFPEVGDGISMHDHTEDQKHNVMVMKGSVEVYGPDNNWNITLKSGDVFSLLDEHHPHEICALEPDTIIFGMFTHGKPIGEDVPIEDRQGTVHDRLPVNRT